MTVAPDPRANPSSTGKPGPASAPLRFARLLFGLLLLLSISLPTMVQPIKMVLLGAILVLLAVAPETWFSRSTPAQFTLDLTALAFAMVGLAWSIAGMLKGNPGAMPSLTVMTIYPCVAVALWRLARPGDWPHIGRILVWSTVAALVTQALFVMSFFQLDGGRIFDWFIAALDETSAVVDTRDGQFVFTLPSISSLLFMCPWLCVAAALGKRWRVPLLLLAVLSLGALLLSGRRAAVVAIAAGLAAAWLLYLSVPRHGGVRSKAGVGLVWLIAVFAAVLAGLLTSGLITPELLVERVASIFDFSTNESNLERRLQFEALVQGIAESPVFGQGLGAAASYSRSTEQPWAYELTYVALVFQFGFFGFSVYALGVAYLFWQLIRLARRVDLPARDRLAIFCFSAGLVAFLTANATNPYLGKFDYMWTLFVPLGMLRLALASSAPQLQILPASLSAETRGGAA